MWSGCKEKANYERLSDRRQGNLEGKKAVCSASFMLYLVHTISNDIFMYTFFNHDESQKGMANQ